MPALELSVTIVSKRSRESIYKKKSPDPDAEGY
jgi:hypothetical protein